MRVEAIGMQGEAVEAPQDEPHRFIDADSALGLALLQLFSAYMLSEEFVVGPAHSRIWITTWMLGLALTLCWSLAEAAEIRGYSRAFGWLGLLGLAGAIVIWALPDRDAESALRGFQVDPAARKVSSIPEDADDQKPQL